MSADLIGTGSQPENTLSIFFMIRSAHCTAAATKDSVLGKQIVRCFQVSGYEDL